MAAIHTVKFRVMNYGTGAAMMREDLEDEVRKTSNLLQCASGSRLRGTAAYAHIFMTFHELVMHERSERTGHKNGIYQKDN